MGNPTNPRIPSPGDFAQLHTFLCPRLTGQPVQVLVYLEQDGPEDMIAHQIMYRDDLGTIDVKTEMTTAAATAFYQDYGGSQAREFWTKTMAEMDEILGLEPWVPPAPATQPEPPSEVFAEDTALSCVQDTPHVPVHYGDPADLTTIMVPEDIHQALVADGVVVGDDPDNQTLAPGVDPNDIHELIATWPGTSSEPVTADFEL